MIEVRCACRVLTGDCNRTNDLSERYATERSGDEAESSGTDELQWNAAVEDRRLSSAS